MKLTESQVQEIKAKIVLGQKSKKQIADEYGVSRGLVSDIAHGRAHKGIKADTEAPTGDERLLFNMRAEVESLRDERNALRLQLKSAAKTHGLFTAVADEMKLCFQRPLPPLPGARPLFNADREPIIEHLVMHLSDGHHDQVVTQNDTGGLERYDFPISCCRAERYIDTVLKWTQQTMCSYLFPSVTVLAYGDHTSGEIHGHTQRSYFRNQFKNVLGIGQLHALMFRDLAAYFGQVNVVYVPGNHGRRSQKKDYHGAHDNWDYMVAEIAKLHCSEIPNVNIQIPNAFCVNLDIDGVGFQIFHGDDIKSSLGIPWYGLEKRRHRMQAINAHQTGTPVRYFCCGHFHRPGSTTEVNGEMIINGAWASSDAYAYNALGGYTEPSQLIHGVNSDYGITWRLPVRLRCAYEHEGPRRYKVNVQ